MKMERIPSTSQRWIFDGPQRDRFWQHNNSKVLVSVSWYRGKEHTLVPRIDELKSSINILWFSIYWLQAASKIPICAQFILRTPWQHVYAFCLVYISATYALSLCCVVSMWFLTVPLMQFIEASTASLNILVCRLIGVYQTQIIGTFVGILYLYELYLCVCPQ